MFRPNIEELIETYARLGVADWTQGKRTHGKAVHRCLARRDLGDTDYDAGRVIAPGFEKLLPVPRCQGLYPAFFHVDLIRRGGNQHLRLELLAVYEDGVSLAFRIESADEPPMAHSYPHAQLSKRMLIGKTLVPTGIPPQINDSYPAFLFRMTDPCAVFLAFAVAIHGLNGGIVTLLPRMFPEGTKVKGYYEHLLAYLKA